LSDNKEFHVFRERLDELGLLPQEAIDESKKALKEKKKADNQGNFLMLAVISVVLAYLISQKFM
jgi:hypothetical protein